jgi:hypothetical protein
MEELGENCPHLFANQMSWARSINTNYQSIFEVEVLDQLYALKLVKYVNQILPAYETLQLIGDIKMRRINLSLFDVP